MNIKQLIKQRVGNKKYPRLLRIKVGKVLFIFASLPLFSAWVYSIAIPMMIPISPTLWVKDKIRDINEWRRLR